MPPLTDNTTAAVFVSNETDASSDPSQANAKRNQVVLQVPVGSDHPSPFEDFDESPQKVIKASPSPGRVRPTPRPQAPQSLGVFPTPTPTAVAPLEPPSYPEIQPVKRSPSVSYNAMAPPLPRATPPPTPADDTPKERWDPGQGQPEPQPQPQPTPTASPNTTQHHHCNHPDKCPCPGPTCVTQTDVVWVHNVTTYAAPNPQPYPTSICETVEHTSVYWETQQGVWLTTVFPVMSTYWVWEKIPHTVQSLSTSFSETFIPGPQPCPLPPSDWCEDGWINGVWHGDGDAPCWYGGHHHHHWHWPGAHDVFGTLGPDQIATLVAIPIMFVIILFLWSIHVLAVIFLLPFQLFTNFIHEVSHVLAGIVGGAKICSVTIDPGCGPLSTMRNGSPAFTLLAGYTGSLLFGWGIVTCAFDEKASKITYIVTAPIWLPAAWFTVGFWPKLQIAIVIGWSIALWYIWEGRLLRFYMLFLGLMSVMYVLWDCLDDFIFKKQNESDASLLSRLYPSVAPGTWGFIFLVISLGVLTCACVSGLHWFQGPRHAYSEDFLPT